MKAKTKRQKHFVTVARREYVTDDVDIDDNPNISPLVDKSGCWVAAWVWVSSGLERAHDD